MNSEIKICLEKLNISNYRIVNHKLKISQVSTVESDLINKQINFKYLFFQKGPHIYRINVQNEDIEEIYKSIIAVIDKELWYCDEIALDTFSSGHVGVVSSPLVMTSNDINELLNRYEKCKIISVINKSQEVEVFTKNNRSLSHIEQVIVRACVESIPGVPYKEFEIINPNSIDDVEYELESFINKLSTIMSVPSSSNFEIQNTGRCIMSPEISKCIINFLCASLNGNQICYGNSFISIEDFGKKFLTNKVSLYKINNIPDAEGSIISKKYYLKEGSLVSAFNDLKTASFFEQLPGDVALVNDGMNSIIEIGDVMVAPLLEELNDNVTIYSEFVEKQILYNQLSGDMSLVLSTEDKEKRLIIKENIIEFFNKVEGAIKFYDVKKASCNYGLVLNLDSKKRGDKL